MILNTHHIKIGRYYQLEAPYEAQHGDLGLSPRELDIIGRLSQGHGNKTIAYDLGISTHTVDTHLRRAYRKLGVQNASAAVAILIGLLYQGKLIESTAEEQRTRKAA